jgi:hypothetical protein
VYGSVCPVAWEDEDVFGTPLGPAGEGVEDEPELVVVVEEELVVEVVVDVPELEPWPE